MIELTLTDQFDFHSEGYRNLVGCAHTTSFQSPEWLCTFYRHLVAKPSQKAMIVVGHSRSTGELQLLLPLVNKKVNHRTVIEYAHADVTDYACPVVHLDLLANGELLSTLPERLYKLLGSYDQLHIKPVRERDGQAWEQLLHLPPRLLEYGAHHVEPSLPFQIWRRQNLGNARRSQLDRKLRRLTDRGNIRLEILSSEATFDAIQWVQEHRKGRFRDDPIQRPETLDFYCEIALTGAAAGLTRTYRLLCGDDPVAVCLGLVDGPSFCYLLLACNYRAYAAYSPGILLLDLAMADWTADGGKIFDFTIGDEPYKRQFRCERRPMYEFISEYSDQ